MSCESPISRLLSHYSRKVSGFPFRQNKRPKFIWLIANHVLNIQQGTLLSFFWNGIPNNTETRIFLYTFNNLKGEPGRSRSIYFGIPIHP